VLGDLLVVGVVETRVVLAVWLAEGDGFKFGWLRRSICGVVLDRRPIWKMLAVFERGVWSRHAILFGGGAFVGELAVVVDVGIGKEGGVR
jgi:hypothetical protein